MAATTVSEKNAVINYAIQTRRIAEMLNKGDVGQRQLASHEKEIFKKAKELVENLLVGAYYVYKPEERAGEGLTFLGLRDFRISQSMFDRLGWTEEKGKITTKLTRVMRLLETIVVNGSIRIQENRDLRFLRDFFERLSNRMHEAMLANKLTSVEDHSSELWPKKW